MIHKNGRKGEETEKRKSGMNEGETGTRTNGRKLATPPGKYSRQGVGRLKRLQGSISLPRQWLLVTHIF